MVKKSNVQTVRFALIYMTIDGHTYKLFQNIVSDVRTKGKWEINTAQHNYC